MSDEEKKKMADLEAANAKLTVDLTTATKTLEDTKVEITKLTTTITEKDALIEAKTQDVVNARKSYGKKLAEMSDEEKKELGQVELELKQKTEDLEKQQLEFQKSQADARAKDIGERRSNIIKRYVDPVKNPDLAKKLEANFGLIKGAEDAATETEIDGYMKNAFNMLGDERPNPISSAVNGAGAAPGSDNSSEKGFADSAEGQNLAQSLNLNINETKK